MEEIRVINNREYYLAAEKNGVSCWISSDFDNQAIVLNEEGEILFNLFADCAQNSGFLALKGNEPENPFEI